MNPADNLLPQGTRLNNLYEIEEHIADGGIGTVYRARDVESGDPVAIKVLLASFSRDTMIVDLFKREAKILRNLKHDALTQYYVFAKEPTLGVYYLAMEFVSGPSLHSRLESGPLEPEAVYRLVQRLASALQAVHDKEVIHRDLSPDNIILQNSDVGQAKIIDFGISRANTGGPTIIGDGFAGKVNYVSPEQVGIFDGKVTARSDIYSLGLVIAEALTGKQIDMGGTQAQIVEKRRIVPSLDGIDNRFRPLLEAMLQPDPANRPASMAEIADWTLGAPLGRQMPDKTVIRTSSPPPEQSALDHEAPPANWGRRILVALSLLGFAGLGAGGVYFIVGQSVPDQDQKPVLVAPPRDNAPEAPTQPTDPTSDDGSSGESTGKETSPTTDDAKNTVPDIPIPDNQDQRPPVNGNETNNNAPPPITPQQDQSQEVLKPEDRIRNFVSSYQAGDCMYLQPVEIASRSAEIEGFASRTPPFIAFDSDFTQSQGFEAKIQVNLVSDDQCPAVAFLRGTPEGNAKTELHLDMQRTVIPNGSNMAGRISGYDPTTGELGLLYVGSKGEVVNLSPFLQTDNGGAGFVVPLSLKSAVEETGLVIAMVGPDVAQSLSNRSEKQASAFFDNLMREVAVLRATATTVKVVP
ncbi:Serine/threonine-protein kinase PknL [Labrenzia sp. THAF82]|uniref:serine/threonine-protein kinase n=1 Tax=Labrenzia sp. THAF82 TaxID=2587861 RepID=UPI0012679D2E|nr:serine/threonine-protein kinase [Labrenzia sp. THAF82]QFT32443.1 Serine/threonine-protein kinase PknL [Labrenzia sp. THAF82]